MTKNCALTLLTILAASQPSSALAADNGPVELTIGIIGMLLIAGVGLYYTHIAEKGANDPNNAAFSDAYDLNVKLMTHLKLGAQYRLEVVRQSGNVERTLEPVSAQQAISQVASTMRRAKIDIVSIRRSGNTIKIYRTMHNGRGRQEGKRIGGFELTEID